MIITGEHMQRANIPKRYWNSEIKRIPDEMPYKEKVISYIKQSEELVPKGVGLYLYSKENSTGKTSLACIIGREVMRRRMGVFYIMASHYSDDIFSGRMVDEIQSVEQRAKTVDLLIIDDAVKEYRGESGFIENKIENLIRYRTQHLKATIFTSNTEPKGIRDVYSPDLAAIMREISIPIEVKGIDWRLEIEKELRNIL